MNEDEIRFFLKYIAKVYVKDIKLFLKGLTNLARPKLWLFVTSILLLYFLWQNRRLEAFITLGLILFTWMWDYWEAGHWRGDMRRELYEKIKKDNKDKDK